MIQVGDGALETRIDGEGPPVVLLHGALMDPAVWDDVVARLPGFRCVRPVLPLGAHRVPLPVDADRTPLGQARRVARLLEALDLRDVTLVGNDSGGAIAQLVAAHHPERVGALVLTNCDALDVFPPPAFAYLKTLAPAERLSGLMLRVLAAFPRLARSKLAFGALSLRPLPLPLLARWLGASRDRAVLHDVCGFFAACDAALTVAAAPRLRGLPIRLVWGRRDPFFTPALAERLAAATGAELEWVEASTLVALDAPEPVAEAIAATATRSRRISA